MIKVNWNKFRDSLSNKGVCFNVSCCEICSDLPSKVLIDYEVDDLFNVLLTVRFFCLDCYTDILRNQ
jgi:hypothetical protein